jgi:hypothetical protein
VRGFPKGWLKLEVTESFRFFHSSTELVDPDTSKMNRLLSEIGIVTALAVDGTTTANRVAPSPVSARTESLLSKGMRATLR